MIEGNAWRKLIGASRIATCSCTFQRGAAIAVGLFNENVLYSNDRHFCVHLSRQGPFSLTHKALSNVRIHQQYREDITNRGAVRRGWVEMFVGMLDKRKERQIDRAEFDATEKELTPSTCKSLFWTSRGDGTTYLYWIRQLRMITPGHRSVSLF